MLKSFFSWALNMEYMFDYFNFLKQFKLQLQI